MRIFEWVSFAGMFLSAQYLQHTTRTVALARTNLWAPRVASRLRGDECKRVFAPESFHALCTI